MSEELKLAATDLVVGAVYRVRWDDCCTAGGFTSRLIAKIYPDDEPDFLSELHWENGVVLDGSLWGPNYEPA